MSEEDRAFYDSVVHGLRSAGWTRSEAEAEALERVERRRAREAIASDNPTKE